jgi:hypothetical protein
MVLLLDEDERKGGPQMRVQLGKATKKTCVHPLTLTLEIAFNLAFGAA